MSSRDRSANRGSLRRALWLAGSLALAVIVAGSVLRVVRARRDAARAVAAAFLDCPAETIRIGIWTGTEDTDEARVEGCGRRGCVICTNNDDCAFHPLLAADRCDPVGRTLPRR